MDWIVIEGIKPYDGRYEFDLDQRELTTGEWGLIKRHSGYLPLTIDEGFQGGDPELFAAFALIALCRAGKIDPRQTAEVFERITEAPFGPTIRFEGEPRAEEDDAGPPESSSSENGSTSGAALPTSSESSTEILPPSGTPGSATSVSDRPTWVN